MTDERNRIIELLDEVIELKKELLGTVQLRAELAAANTRLEEAALDTARLESRTIRLYAPTEFAEHVIFEDVDLRAAIDDAMERHAIQMASYERQISVWLRDRVAHSDENVIREASLERHISRPGNE